MHEACTYANTGTPPNAKGAGEPCEFWEDTKGEDGKPRTKKGGKNPRLGNLTNVRLHSTYTNDHNTYLVCKQVAGASWQKNIDCV